MKKQAAMFDIDDTLIEAKTGLPIVNIIDLLNNHRQQGFSIILITARPSFQTNVEWTIGQLEELDIYYDELWFSPAPEKGRLKRESDQYDFIISVGDQPTDLTDSVYYVQVL